MTAKEYLLQAWNIDRRIEAKIEERDRLRAKLEAGRMTRLTGMPRGGGGDWTDTVSRVIELDRQISGEIMQLCAVKREVNAAIEAVEPIRYREILALRYRNYMRWEEIAETMGYDKRYMFKIHGRALRAVRLPEKGH